HDGPEPTSHFTGAEPVRGVGWVPARQRLTNRWIEALERTVARRADGAFGDRLQNPDRRPEIDRIAVEGVGAGAVLGGDERGGPILRRVAGVAKADAAQAGEDPVPKRH